MRTTIRLDDRLLTQARREAARCGETLTALIERAVRLTLAQRLEGSRRQSVELPVSSDVLEGRR